MLRHILVSLLIGLAVFAALQTATSFVATTPIIVAKRAIARGEPIAAEDIELHKVTSNITFQHAASSPAEVVERITQVDIAPGQPLFPSMIAPAPAVPEHYTVIDVRLYGKHTDLVTGMNVSLVASSEQGCPGSPSNELSTDSSLCVLATEAIVMPATKHQAPSPNHRRFAMLQEEAAHVMQVHNLADVLAVVNHAR